MPRPVVRYALSFEHRLAHQVHVQARLPVRGRRMELRLPVWTPGSYLIREYSRHLRDLKVTDARGRALPLRRIDKAGWEVETGGARSLRLDYGVHAFDPGPRTSHLDAQHAFLSGPTLFISSPELRRNPVELTLRLPRSWKTATTLTPKKRGLWRADDYDQLLDAPIELGRFRSLEFEASDTPFRMVVCGDGPLPARRLRRDLARIAEACHKFWGSFPFSSYLTILHLTPEGRGGVEHLDSTVLAWPRLGFETEAGYTNFLKLFAHELFHAWNVKSLAPAAFRPYDYTKENYTRLLWWFEGATDYFAERLVLAAGLMPPIELLERSAERLERLLATPGRLEDSLEQASYNAWIKLYRPDESLVNSSVSYYQKGYLAALALDWLMRSRTRGRRGLEHLARALYKRYAGVRRGVPEDGIQPLAEQLAGGSLDEFFERYIAGTEELPLAELAQTHGLQLRRLPRPGGSLGIRLDTHAGGSRIGAVLNNSPAERAGLEPGDQLVAVDGWQIKDDGLSKRLERLSPGRRCRLTVIRSKRLARYIVRLGKAPAALEFVPAARPDPEALRLLELWLGAPPERLLPLDTADKTRARSLV